MAKAVTLNLIVDKSCNRVRFAESDGHFVDILLSFLTLPLGSILRLTKQSIGSMNNLLQSVENLHSECFRSEACRSMLLCPSNSAADQFSSLPIKYDNISNLFRLFYTSSSCDKSCPNFYANAHCLTFYANAHCPCGCLVDKKLEFVGDSASSNAKHYSVFFNGAFKFTISDDLLVSQPSVEFAIEHLSKLEIKQRSYLESVRVEVTAEKIIELLKRLLVSDTPLTDVFLIGNKEKDKLQVIQQQPLRAKWEETEAPAASTRNISMKLYVNKEENKALIAEVDSDFVNLLFGFLTYPMGSVISKLGGQSGIRCMDNLYNSVEALKSANCFRNNELIGMLLNPKLPAYFKVKNQLINLDEEPQTKSYFSCSNICCHQSSRVGSSNSYTCKYCRANTKELYLRDPKHGCSDDHSTGGYMRTLRYMVTDDLVTRQPSSFMAITAILREAAGKDIRARNIEIGKHEALALLRASITSENVLSDALLGMESGKRRCRSY